MSSDVQMYAPTFESTNLMNIVVLNEISKRVKNNEWLTLTKEQFAAMGGKCKYGTCKISLRDILTKALCDNLRCIKGEIPCFDPNNKMHIRKQVEDRMDSIKAFLSELPDDVYDAFTREPSFDAVYSDDEEDAPSKKRLPEKLKLSKKKRVKTDATSPDKASPAKPKNNETSVQNESSVASPQNTSPTTRLPTNIISPAVETSMSGKIEAQKDIVSEEEEIASNHDYLETDKNMDKGDSDKDSDKEDSDKENSDDKEDSDKEDSDKEDSDKKDSDKEDSDKEESYSESNDDKESTDNDSDESASECD